MIGAPCPQLGGVVGSAFVTEVGPGETRRVPHPRRGLRVARVERRLQGIVGELDGPIEVSHVHLHLGELTEAVRPLELDPTATEGLPHHLEPFPRLGEVPRPQALPGTEDRWPATEEWSLVNGGEQQGALDQPRDRAAGHQRHGRQRSGGEHLEHRILVLLGDREGFATQLDSPLQLAPIHAEQPPMQVEQARPPQHDVVAGLFEGAGEELVPPIDVEVDPLGDRFDPGRSRLVAIEQGVDQRGSTSRLTGGSVRQRIGVDQISAEFGE